MAAQVIEGIEVNAEVDVVVEDAPATPQPTTCNICAENFNKTVRQRIQCENCQMDICMKCIKRFLAENVQEPNCMNCREVYTKEFMDKTLGYTYRRRILKTVRLEVLMAREKEFMPDLMHRAQAYREVLRMDEEMDKNNIMLTKAKTELQQLTLSKDQMDKTIQQSLDNSGADVDDQKYIEFMKKSQETLASFYRTQKIIAEKITLHKSLSTSLYSYRNNQWILYRSAGTVKTNAQMYCVRTDCKGFLNDEYVCGLCNLKVCKDCHEELSDELHVCKQENIDSVKAIENETKPCPTCRTRVYKTEGCDQMFCVKCHTAFSWDTGAIERGRIHNPHYFEWLRQQRQEMPREIGDVPCGGLPNWGEVQRAVKALGVDVLTLTYLNVVYKMTQFIQNKEVPKYPVQAGRDEYLNRIAVDYMADILTERQWKDRLYNIEKKKEVNTERRLILDMILAVLIDIFRDLLVIETKDGVDDKIQEINALRKYFNKSIKNLGHRFDLYNFKRISKTWMEWVC
jgi:hypothetical protein